MEPTVADLIFIDAPPATVFDALVDPNEALEWLDAFEARIAAEPNGEFTIVREDGSTMSGVVKAITKNEGIEIVDYYREQDGVRRGPMTLTLELHPKDGGVFLVVRQEGLDATGEGWEEYAGAARAEWVQATVALKRRIEQI